MADEAHQCTACEYNYFHDGGCCKVISIDKQCFKLCIPCCCENGVTLEKVSCANPKCEIMDILVTREATCCPFCDNHCHYQCFIPPIMDKSKNETHACPPCIDRQELELEVTEMEIDDDTEKTTEEKKTFMLLMSNGTQLGEAI